LAAENLNGVVDDLPQRLGRPHLEHGRFEHVILKTAVDEMSAFAGSRLHREGMGGHPGDFLFHQFEIGNWLLKLHAFLVVAGGGADTSFSCPSAAGAECSASKVKYGQCDTQPLADLSQHVFGRYDHVLEGNPAGGVAANAGLCHAWLQYFEA